MLRIEYHFNDFSHGVSSVKEHFTLDIRLLLVELTSTRSLNINFNVFFAELKVPHFISFRYRLLHKECFYVFGYTSFTLHDLLIKKRLTNLSSVSFAFLKPENSSNSYSSAIFDGNSNS